MSNQITLQDFKALVFKVGQEEYGVHINQVISIERMQEITPYPNRPMHVLGVTTIRDIVTPVVDLRTAILGETQQLVEDSRIIIFQVHDRNVGLVVDAATDVLDIASNSIQYPNLLEMKEVSYIKGISKLEQRLIILLDIEILLEDTTNLDELKELKNSI